MLSALSASTHKSVKQPLGLVGIARLPAAGAARAAKTREKSGHGEASNPEMVGIQ